MANHVSFLDVFAIPCAFDTSKKFSAVAAAKNFKIPLIGSILYRITVKIEKKIYPNTFSTEPFKSFFMSSKNMKRRLGCSRRPQASYKIKLLNYCHPQNLIPYL